MLSCLSFSGILTSATLAHVEGKEEAEVTADADTGAAGSKKKRKKKKKKKKKSKSTEAVDTEVAVTSSAVDSVVCRDVDMRDTIPEDKQTALTEPAPEEAGHYVDMGDKETKVEEKEESQDTSPMETAAEDVEDLGQKSATSAAERDASFDNNEEEEEESQETKPRSFDVLDDAAVLAVGRRPLIELGTSSDSDTEHRPFYDEEYVTVDEEAPTPLLSAVQGECFSFGEKCLLIFCSNL